MQRELESLASSVGIKPVVVENLELKKAQDASATRYVISVGETIDLRGRQLPAKFLPRGRFVNVETHFYFDLNTNDSELLRKDGSPDAALAKYEKSAADCTKEIIENYTDWGTVSPACLVGQPHQFVKALEQLILPEVPETLMKLSTYVNTQSTVNVQDAIDKGILKDDKAIAIAHEVVKEIQLAIRKAVAHQDNQLRKTEAELAAARAGKPYRKGFLDEKDFFYYNSLERRPPTNNDLLYKEEEKSDNSIDKLAEALGRLSPAQPAPVAPSAREKELEAEVADMKAKFEALMAKLDETPKAKGTK